MNDQKHITSELHDESGRQQAPAADRAAGVDGAAAPAVQPQERRRKAKKYAIVGGILLIAGIAILVPGAYIGSVIIPTMALAVAAAAFVLLLCALYQRLMVRGFKNCPTDRHRRRKALAALAAIVAGVGLLILLIMWFTTQPNIAAALALPFGVAAVVLLCCTLNEHLAIGAEARGQEHNALPFAALLLDIAGAALLFGGMLLFDMLFGIGLLMMFLSLFAPLGGVICGILALADRRNIGKGGVAVSIVAIALPVVAVITVILLFSTGVIVIRLM